MFKTKKEKIAYRYGKKQGRKEARRYYWEKGSKRYASRFYKRKRWIKKNELKKIPYVDPKPQLAEVCVVNPDTGEIVEVK